jgi:hypothetical protein
MRCSIRPHTAIVFTSYHYFIFDIIIIIVVYDCIILNVFVERRVYYYYYYYGVPIILLWRVYDIYRRKAAAGIRAYLYYIYIYIHNASFEKISHDNISSDFRHKLKHTHIYIYRLCCTRAYNIIYIYMYILLYDAVTDAMI